MDKLQSIFKKTLLISLLSIFSSQVSAEYYLTYEAQAKRDDFPLPKTYVCNPCCCYYQPVKHHYVKKHHHVKKHYKKAVTHHIAKKHHRKAKTGWYAPALWVNGHYVDGQYLGEGFNVYPRKIKKHMTQREVEHYDADLTTGDDNPYLNPDMNIDY